LHFGSFGKLWRHQRVPGTILINVTQHASDIISDKTGIEIRAELVLDLEGCDWRQKEPETECVNGIGRVNSVVYRAGNIGDQGGET
jgi:hypothetical protein